MKLRFVVQQNPKTTRKSALWHRTYNRYSHNTLLHTSQSKEPEYRRLNGNQGVIVDDVRDEPLDEAGFTLPDDGGPQPETSPIAATYEVSL